MTTIHVGNFSNSGTLEGKTGTLRSIGELTQFTNGQTILSGGKLHLSVFDMEGSFVGTGEVLVDEWYNKGSISLGGSTAGRLHINGAYIQTETGSLHLRIFGANSFDLVTIFTTATLAGTLDVDLMGGYAPTGEIFTLIQFDNREGFFDTLDIFPLGIEYFSDRIDLVSP